MKASSEKYVTLQTIFRTKAKEDLELFSKLLEEVLKEVGLSEEGRIGQEEMEGFVKHAGFLMVVRGRSLREEFERNDLKGKIGELLSWRDGFGIGG